MRQSEKSSIDVLICSGRFGSGDGEEEEKAEGISELGD